MSFIGTLLAKGSARGFSLGHWLTHQVGDEVPPHGHERAHVMWAMGGDYATEAAGTTPSGRDIVVYNSPGVFHRDRFLSSGARYFAVDVTETDLGSLVDDQLPSAPRQIASESARAALRRLAGECARWDADSATIVEALCLELLAAIAGVRTRERRAPAWLQRACAMLQETTPTSVAAVAAEAGVHPTHLVRTFRIWFDCTPGEYARNRRLMRAACLLKDRKQKISRISFETGFADQSHLTRVFRSAFGVTPAAYRNVFAGAAR